MVLILLASAFAPAQAALTMSHPASETPWGTLANPPSDSDGTNPGAPDDDDADNDDDGQDDVLPPPVRESPSRSLHHVIRYPRFDIVCASQHIGSPLFRPPCF